MLTPLSTANRPGLSELSYRIGTHGSFLETMKARLSSGDYPKLAELTTRDSDDPSIALLDAWATVADVLTFYQERIANEGYLRTATEQRSIEELGRLVGYQQRPGISASTYLAYTIEDKHEEEVSIPSGSRVQSVPGQDELPQTFESGEDLRAHADWNNLAPRLSRQQHFLIPGTDENNRDIAIIYLKGIQTNLKLNDRLLITFEGISVPDLYRVTNVKPEAEAGRTCVTMQLEYSPAKGGETEGLKIEKVEALRRKTAPFGHNALLKPVYLDNEKKVMKHSEWTIENSELPPNPPKARFTAVVDGLTVTFTNESTPEKQLDSVSWDFGDRKRSEDFSSPSHAYDKEGEYTVTLIVKGPGGTAIHTEKINLYPQPTASFEVVEIKGKAVTFQNTSTGFIKEAIWHFSEAPSVKEETQKNKQWPAAASAEDWPEIICNYPEEKEYTVTLSVKGPGGTATYTEKVKTPPCWPEHRTL